MTTGFSSLRRDPAKQKPMHNEELERLADERVRDCRDLIAGGLPFSRALEITGADPANIGKVSGSAHPAPSPDVIAERAAEIRAEWSFATQRSRYA